MLIAISMTDDDRKCLVLGLQPDDVQRLEGGDPIYKNMHGIGALGIEEWDIWLLGPGHTEQFDRMVGDKAVRFGPGDES